MNKQSVFEFEMTDTFGDEANYSWVKRGRFSLLSDISRLALIRRLKKWAGLTGVRCLTEYAGDWIQITPLQSEHRCIRNLYQRG